MATLNAHVETPLDEHVFLYTVRILVQKFVLNVSSNRILSNYQYFNHETNKQRTTPSFEINIHKRKRFSDKETNKGTQPES